MLTKFFGWLALTMITGVFVILFVYYFLWIAIPVVLIGLPTLLWLRGKAKQEERSLE